MPEEYDTIFPTGVVVFFRLTSSDGSLTRSVLPTGRAVMLGRSREFEAHDEDYVVVDGNNRFLACFPREFVSAILPLETTGPGDANNPPKPTHN